MSRKYLIWAIPSLLAVGVTAWAVSSLWRSNHHLVRLHVRNAPLADVIRAIQRQTGAEIKFDGNADALVTLNFRNKPLTDVLDRLTQQTGADWTTVYAVYESTQLLSALAAMLPHEANLQEAGWKKIAPGGLVGPGLEPESRAQGPRLLQQAIGRGPIETEDVVVKDTGTNNLRGGSQFRNQRPNGPVVIVRKNGDGGAQEVWSPVELLMETRLCERLTNDFSGTASYEQALEASREAHGHLKIFYALHKSKFGMGLAGMPPMQPALIRGGPQGMRGRPNAVGLDLSSAGQNLEEAIRRQKLEELGRLTPEQRVLRSRERQQHQVQP
jgi:hypothetical protein